MGAEAIRCFLALAEESRSVIEKERRGRDASSERSVDGRERDCERPTSLGASGLEANMAVMLSGVPGRLTKNTLSPSSLVESSRSSAPVVTDFASTSVGLCLSSGNILRNPPAVVDDALLFASVRSFAIFALKKCAYSTSLSVLAECNCSSIEGPSVVISSRAVCCCRVADRWWLVAGRRNDGRRDPDAWTGVS